MVTAISNMIFQSPITCKLREEKTILLHPTGSSQQMIEATFDLNLQAIKNDADPLIVPLMLAQTNKNAEKKISRSVSNMLAVSCVVGLESLIWQNLTL